MTANLSKSAGGVGLGLPDVTWTEPWLPDGGGGGLIVEGNGVGFCTEVVGDTPDSVGNGPGLYV